MRIQREKNLCFNCDEKFIPGHRCQAQSCFIEVDNPLVVEEIHEEEPLSTDTPPDPLISLHALSGSLGNRTMQVRAMVNRQEIHALINGGSSHNFINQAVVNRLNLAVTPITPFYVRVASGEKLACQARLRRYPFAFKGFLSRLRYLPYLFRVWISFWAINGWKAWDVWFMIMPVALWNLLLALANLLFKPNQWVLPWS